MPEKICIDGNRYGKLLVLSTFKKAGKSYCLCRCDCGKTKNILKGNLNRKNRGPKSCGCAAKDRVLSGPQNPNYKHGHGSRVGSSYGSPTHRIWRGIKDRCLNKNNHSYPMYGGRGIYICDRWLDFENFLEDMGERPDGKSIDRIDNDDGYRPGNCRWASSTEQTRNARSNVLNYYFGELLCVTEASEKFGIPENRLRMRLYRGEHPESAVTRKVYDRSNIIKSY